MAGQLSRILRASVARLLRSPRLPESPANTAPRVLIAPAASELTRRHLIFCISSGRAGSRYLAELLGTACGVRSFHEPDPSMSGEPLHLINTLPIEASRQARRVKACAITDTLRSMQPLEVYAETNHMFIKTFYDVVLTEFSNVDVVILRRSLPHVVKSFIELGYFSPLNATGWEWMSSPNAATAALPALAPDDRLDQYDAAIAYLLDIEARAQRFIRDYPWVRVHEARLEALQNADGAASLLERLNLHPTEATGTFAGRVINDRPHRKRQFNNPTTLEECRRRLHDYVARAEKAGIAIPRTAAMD